MELAELMLIGAGVLASAGLFLFWLNRHEMLAQKESNKQALNRVEETGKQAVDQCHTRISGQGRELRELVKESATHTADIKHQAKELSTVSQEIKAMRQHFDKRFDDLGSEIRDNARGLRDVPCKGQK